MSIADTCRGNADETIPQSALNRRPFGCSPSVLTTRSPDFGFQGIATPAAPALRFLLRKP